MRLRCWIVVDMHYEPRPIIVYASANRDNAVEAAAQRNRYRARRKNRRFRIFTAATGFLKATTPTEETKE